jgi:hypothetical protein
MFIYICKKKGTLSSVLFLLSLVELAYLIETVIYIYGGSYEYHPNIVKNGGFYDSNAGAVVSNLFTIPVIAAFIASFQLKWPWIALFTGLLALIEWLFIELGIYTLNWWKIGYTSFGLFFVFFPTAKLIYRKIMQPSKGFWHSLFLFLCTAPILANFQIFPIILLFNRYYSLGLFKDTARETTAFLSVYYVGITIILIAFIKYIKQPKYLKYIVLTALLIIINVSLDKAEILHSTTWWDKAYYILMPLLVLRIAEGISKRLTVGLGRWLKP